MPKPVGRDIAVKVRKLERKSAGGIIYTDTTRQENSTAINVGEVVELGEYAYWYDTGFKPWCKPGDQVYFISYVGFKIPSREDEEYYIRMVPEDAIKGLVTPGDAHEDVEFVVGLRNK